MKDIMKDRSDVVILVKLAGTNNQMDGGVKHHLQVAGDLNVSMRRIRTANRLNIVNPGRKVAATVVERRLSGTAI